MKFVANYWPILVAFIVSAIIFTSSEAFKLLGTLLYIPVLTFGGILLALAFRSVFNRDTTWPYVYDHDPSRGYDGDFYKLPGNQRVWLTAIQIWVYLLFIAFVIHAAMG